MTRQLNTFDAARYLESPDACATYLASILEENNAQLLAIALGDIARARGMASIAHDAGIAREALYKALKAGAQPRFETVSRVLGALGLRLSVEVVEHAS